MSRRRRPPFQRVAIVGVGLIGGSIGLATRRLLPGTRVVGIDRDPVLRRARARGALHEGTTRLSEGLRGADLVVLALPVDGIVAILPRVARHLPPGAVLTDVGSTKREIDRAARTLALGGRFVGGHPMAGSERPGIDHADGRLFSRAAWVLCPTPRSAGPGARRPPAGTPLRRLSRFVRRLGARPVLLRPAAHDRVVARLSHLPQLVSVALTNAACRAEARRHLHLSGPALRQMSRLAASPPRLWAGILKSNRAAAERAIDDVIGELVRLKRALPAGARSPFLRAARGRERLMETMRGGRALG